MCARVVDVAHNNSIEGGIFHSSIAGTVEDVPDARIVTPTDLVEVSTMIDLICYCSTSYAPLTDLSHCRNHPKSK